MEVETFEEITGEKTGPKLESFEEITGGPEEKEDGTQSSFGQIFPVKREQRPGVWGINQQLDGLFSGRSDITDLLPADVGYDFGRVVGMSDPEDLKSRMAGSIMYSVLFDVPAEIAFDNFDSLNKQIFGKELSPTAAWRNNQKLYSDTKTWVDVLRHGNRMLGTRMVKSLAGGAKMLGEYLSMDKGPRYIENAVDSWLEEKGEKITEWSDFMLAGVKDYYENHPEEAIQITPGLGYRETLRQYITSPKKLVQGIIESSSLIMEGIMGTIIGGPAGGIVMMAIPISGEVYADARDEKTEPLPAMGQAMLTGLGEAVIEQWTLGKKLGLTKNFRKIVSDGLPKVIWESAKAFFRGTAEEGSQEFNRNFWRWVFTDRRQLWSENVSESMAAGGPMEMVMSGAFSASGMAVGPAVTIEEQIARLDKIQEAVDISVMPESAKKEITTEIDNAREDVKKGIHITWDDVSTERKEQLARIGTQKYGAMGMKQEQDISDLDEQAQRHLKQIAAEGNEARARIAQEGLKGAKETITPAGEAIVAPTEAAGAITGAEGMTLAERQAQFKQKLSEVKEAIKQIAPDAKVEMAHPNAKNAIQVNKEGTEIQIHPDLLQKIKEQYPGQETEMLQLLVEEELIHQEQIQEHGGAKQAEKAFAEEWNNASEDLKQIVREVVGEKRGDAQMGAELLRIKEQLKRGKIAEDLVSKRKDAVKKLRDILAIEEAPAEGKREVITALEKFGIKALQKSDSLKGITDKEALNILRSDNKIDAVTQILRNRGIDTEKVEIPEYPLAGPEELRPTIKGKKPSHQEAINLAVDEAMADVTDVIDVQMPEYKKTLIPAEGKQPWEMTREELKEEYQRLYKIEKPTEIDKKRELEVKEAFLKIALAEFDESLSNIEEPWQITAQQLKVPGAIKTIPKDNEIGGGVRIAIPSSRIKGEWQVSQVSADIVLGKAIPFTHIEFETKEGALAYLKNIHKAEIKEAIKQNKPVPREVLEEYKSEKWAQKALEQAPAAPERDKIEALQAEIAEREAEQTDEQLSGITKKRRRALIKETAEKIKAHDIYQTEFEGIERRGREIGPGFYYVHESLRGEVEGAIEDITDKKLRNKVKRMFTFDISDLNSGQAIAWDTAIQEGFITEPVEGQWQTRELDISEFVRRVKQAVEAGEELAGLSRVALERFAESGHPDAEMLAEKMDMLRRGSSDIEINAMITEWAERNDVPIDAVADEFVNPEKFEKLAAMPEEELEDELERIATEQILIEDQIAAQQSAMDVLKANKIEAEVAKVEEIEYEDEVPFEQRGRPTGAAMTQGQREVILLALGADIETGAHEGWHLLRSRLTEADSSILNEQFKNDEEAEAAAFGRFYKERKAPTSAIRTIFEKIRSILAKIKSALAGKGIRTVDDIFGEAAAGRIEKLPAPDAKAAPERDLKFETSSQRLRREAEERARINARKARLREQLALAPKKARRTRLKIQIREEMTPELIPGTTEKAKAAAKAAGDVYVYPEPKPGQLKGPKVLLDDAFLEDQVEKVSMTMRERFGPGAGDVALGLSKTFLAMSDRLERIDPTLKYATRRYVFDAQDRTSDLSDDAFPMIEAWRKFSKADRRKFMFAAWNGMHDQIYSIAGKYGAVEQVEQFRQVMDDIFRFCNELGMKMNYDMDHWPRAVKDFKGLINFLERSEYWSPIEQALIKRKEQAGGRELTEDEQIQVIHTLMRGFTIGGVSLSRPGFAKERTIEVLDKQIERFYHKFDEGIGIYIAKMMHDAGAREFFGKETEEITKLRAQKARLLTSLYAASTRIGYKKPIPLEKHEEHISTRRKKLDEVSEELERKKTQRIEDTIGYHLMRLRLEKRINYEQQHELFGIFRAIFDPKGTHGFWQKFIKLSYLDTLANTEVAITQLEEMGLSFYQSKAKAVPALSRAFTGRSKVTLKQMTITDVNQYIQDLGFHKIGDALLFALRKADAPSKEALGNICIDIARDLAQNPDEKFKTSMRQMFGNKAGQVIEDLKSGKITADIRFIGFNGIADHQPIAITETSEIFARAGNLRVAYMLRQFTMRRLSNLHKRLRRIVMTNPAKDPLKFISASIDLMQYIAILTAFGVGKDVIRAWYDGDPFDEDDLWASVVDNLLEFILLSRWTAKKSVREGPGAAIAQEIMPPTKLIDALWKDVSKGEINKTVRSIPYIGERYYQWYGGGSKTTRFGYGKGGGRSTGRIRKIVR